MWHYIVRRLLQMILVVFAATFLIYTMVWAIPGDPFIAKCGYRPCPDSYVTAMREQFHLNDSLPTQYAYYLKGIVNGDLGTTYNNESVAEEIRYAYPATVRLALIALGFEVIIGVLAGIIAAIYQKKIWDYAVLISTLVVIAVPVFVIGFMLQIGVGLKWGLLPPVVGKGAPWGDLILPGFCLSLVSLAFVTRLVRAELVNNLRADYIRTAIAKGLPQRRVIGVHAMRNSLIPVLTFLGVDFGALLGGSIVIEGIFGINGVGGLVYESIARHEGALVVGVVTALVLVFLVINLIVDILYAFLDPRIRYG